jgi:SAM-dependent methyltransferase
MTEQPGGAGDLLVPPPPVPGPAAARLREDLDGAGYTVRGLEERVGAVARRALDRDQAVPVRREIADARDPRAVLLRLFVLGDPVARADVDAALPRTGTAGLATLGLVETAEAGAGDEVRATADIEPHTVEDDDGTASWWVVSDHGEMALGGRPLPPGHVLGVGTASLTLATAVIPPRPGDRAADIGCGSGVQTLHLSRHTDHLIATDASPRAAAFTRLTLGLNGVSADVRVGDLASPLTERMDRVVANLPFVVTPRGGPVPDYTYRDGGAVGDELSARAFRDFPSRLTEGGVAQFLANWEVRGGEAWDAPVRRWVADAATTVAGDVLDTWVVQREVADPALYAEAWIADGGRPDPDTARARYEAWLDDFATRGVESIGFGIVTMRRRASGTALRRFDGLPQDMPDPLRVSLAAGLAGHDALDVLGAVEDPETLLGAHLRVADGLREYRDHIPGRADPATITLVDTRRLGTTVQVSTPLAATVGACDGELTVAAITSAVAALLDTGEGDVRAQVLPALVRLVADGSLEVVTG